MEQVLSCPELLLHTFSYLGGRDLAACAQVCQLWNVTADDANLWKTLCVDSDMPERPSPTQVAPPEWAGSWKGLWAWTYECTSRKFTEQDGDKAGRGQFRWPTGCCYSGEWLANHEHGRGRKVWCDGASFYGTFTCGKFNGWGIHQWASGSTYTGQWQDHRRNGKGRNVWPTETYEGDWKDDQKCGMGTYVWSDGRKYVGEWLQDKRWGTGTFTWPAYNCTYEGSWCQDKRHGHGVFHWENGDRFEGDWKMGKRCGSGRFIRASDGRVFLQTWHEEAQFDMSYKGDLSQEVEADPTDMDVDEESDGDAHSRKRKLAAASLSHSTSAAL